MSFEHLPEKQARMAEELYQSLRAAADKDLRAMAELLALVCGAKHKSLA